MTTRLFRMSAFALFLVLATTVRGQFDNTYIHNTSDDHTSMTKTHNGLGYVQASTYEGATHDIHLMKYTASGGLMLDVTFDSGTTDEFALDIARGNNDSYVICGYERIGLLDLGFVMRVDTNFVLINKVNFQVPANDRHTPALNIINSAYYDKVVQGQYWPGDPNGGYLITGFEAVGYNATDSKSAYVIKVDNNLTVQWARKFDSPISAGTPDWDMTSNANWMWIGAFGYLIGGSGTSPAGEQCAMAAHLDLSGNIIWSQLYSDNNVAGSFCVAADGAFDDAVPVGGEFYHLVNFSQTQSGGIVAFNRLTGAINMAKTRYLISPFQDYYTYEFAATCASTEILISGYGLNQTAGPIQGTFPFVIRYNKEFPMVDTWWQHYAYPVQSANYNPSTTIFDTYSTSEQPRIYYPKLFASKSVNELAMVSFEDNTTWHENHVVQPFFDGKDSCEYVDPQIVAVPMPIHTWTVNSLPATYTTTGTTPTQNVQSPTVTICNACVADASFTLTPGANCSYTFSANNPGNFCSLFTITDVSNTVIYSSPANTGAYTFTLNGTYTICYSDCAIGSDGTPCRDEQCQTIVVNCPPPCPLDADFSFTVTGCCVTFSDNTPEGDPFGCEAWIFGNISSVLAGDNISFCFPGSGTYTVCHMDCCYPAGLSTPVYHQVCKQVTVNCTPPCCLPNDFTIAASGCCRTFTPTYPSTACSAMYFYWNFGDGNTSTSPNPTHCYAGSGIYTVCMTAYCGKMNKITICKKIKVICFGLPWGGGVSTNFGYSVSGTQMQLYDESQPGTGGTITSRTWSFGDGGSSTDADPLHIYAVSGTYEVTLTLEGTSSGEAFTSSHTEMITVVLNPACGCKPPATSAFIDTPVACLESNSVSLHLIDFDGEADVTHQWLRSTCCCGDCDDTSDWTEIEGAIGQQAWVHGVEANTSFRCRSRSNTTGLETWSDIVEVTYGHFDAALGASPPVVCSGAASTLTASPADGTLYEWEPAVSSGVTATVTPTATTTYDVVVTNDEGCGALAQQTVAVNPCTPPYNNDMDDAQHSPASGSAYPSGNCYNGSLEFATVSAQGNPANVLPAGGQDLWYSFVANTPACRIVCTSASQDIVLELHDSGGAEVDVENDVSGPGGEIMHTSGLITGQTYYVAVRSYDGVVGTFNVCIQRLMLSRCDFGSGTYQLCASFKADWTGANSYTFNFVPTGTTTGVPTSITGSTIIVLSNPLLALQYGGTYDVTVDDHFVFLDGAGNVESISLTGVDVCQIVLGPHANLEVKPQQHCPATLLRGSSVLHAKPFVCSAINHTVEFTEVSDCTGSMITGIPFEVTTTGSSSTLALNFINPQPLTNQTYYSVRWRPNFATGPGTYGVSRIVFIGGSAMDELPPPGAPRAEENESMVEAILYPNPNEGTSVTVDMNSIDIQPGESYATLRLLDGMGRVIYAGRFTAGSPDVIHFRQRLASGIYIAEISYNNEILIERMIVN